MKLLVSERDAVANRIYLYLVTFVGKGIVYLECLGKKTWFQFYFFKKTKLSMLFNSTKHVLSVLHALLHLIPNKMYKEGVSTFPFYRWGNWDTETLMALLVREIHASEWAYISI